MRIKQDTPFVYRGIGISGKMCAGKSLAATILAEELRWPIRSLAGELKRQVCHALVEADLDGPTEDDLIYSFKDNLRGLYQNWGDIFRVINGNDWWVKLLLHANNPPFIVDDVRLPEELKVLRRNGFLLIRIEVTPETQMERVTSLYPSTTLEQLHHQSETALDNYYGQFDIGINNNGTKGAFQDRVLAQIKRFATSGPAQLL